MTSTGFVATTRMVSGAFRKTSGIDRAKDGRIPLEELQARLPRLLPHPGRHDHHPGAGQIRAAPSPDLQRMGEGHGVEDVGGLGPRTLLVHVHQDDLAADTPHDERVGRGGSDRTRSDDSDLHASPLPAADGCPQPLY